MSTYDPSDFTASTKLYDPEPIELQPKFMVGLTTGVEGNCLFLSDDVVVYPVSGVIVIYDTKNRSQKFIQFTEQPAKTTITAMDLNPINLVLAVATTSTEDGIKPTVSFYDLTTLELKHTFTEPEDEYPGSTERRQRFASVQFLNDNAYITALAVSDSDCVLYYYNWKNSNLDTCVRVNNPVADVAINPIDTTICCFVGKDLFRSMTRTDTGWNQYGFREAAGVDFTCVCWLCGDRCLSGTSNGWVVLMKNGQLQAVYCLDDLNWELDVTVKMTIDESLGTIVISKNKPPPDAIRICVAFQSGFVLVVGNSTIYYFQKLDEDDRPR
ncbi:WD40/YVTN repeat-like-containing domain,WD40-repeat-containing domain [Cinara cedri]|uniref:WD40/YVTN repeat-like-containing domain,WD40-repeat-containing domain n=1 Tax=Cinara cedri TaxID=506608 RepID=A0A5E4MN91_9HEMI|nr:WD40/YVTN repeat-like-containing domain,WD40-repeat-containing domain [Cinara cedri]